MLCSQVRANVLRRLIPTVIQSRSCSNNSFETVFSLPSIRYIALLNRLKVYHLFGASLLVPTCGAMEIANMIPESTFLTAAYIGVTGAALLSIASIPFKNVIGFLYVNDDNTLIKISSVDYWGRRKDRIINVDDWIPLVDIEPKKMDAIYLTPSLSDGSKYKLFIRFGKIWSPSKFGEVFE